MAGQALGGFVEAAHASGDAWMGSGWHGQMVIPSVSWRTDPRPAWRPEPRVEDAARGRLGWSQVP